MSSRFGLDPAALQRGAEPAHEADKPTCTNCRNGVCNRCPTAITMHGRSSWSSDFYCGHYDQDPGVHADLVIADDEAFYALYQERGYEGHGYWGNDDSPRASRWDSVGGQFPDD